MAFTHIQGVQGAGTSPLTISVGAVGALHLLVINIKHAIPTLSVSITDNASVPNSYLKAFGPVSNFGVLTASQYYGVAVTGGATSITVTWVGGGSARVAIDEFSGNATSNTTVFDTADSNNTSTLEAQASLDPGFPLKPENQGELIVAGLSTSVSITTVTPGSPYILGSTSATVNPYYRLAGELSETAPISWGNGSGWIEIVGAYFFSSESPTYTTSTSSTSSSTSLSTSSTSSSTSISSTSTSVSSTSTSHSSTSTSISSTSTSISSTSSSTSRSTSSTSSSTSVSSTSSSTSSTSSSTSSTSTSLSESTSSTSSSISTSSTSSSTSLSTSSTSSSISLSTSSTSSSSSHSTSSTSSSTSLTTSSTSSSISTSSTSSSTSLSTSSTSSSTSVSSSTSSTSSSTSLSTSSTSSSTSLSTSSTSSSISTSSTSSSTSLSTSSTSSSVSSSTSSTSSSVSSSTSSTSSSTSQSSSTSSTSSSLSTSSSVSTSSTSSSTSTTLPPCGFFFDTSVTSINNGFSNTTNTYTWTHTITGYHPLLILCVSWTSVPGDGSHVSAATYGGNTLTQVNAQVTSNTTVTSTVVTEMWYMAAPPTGSATMSVTISAGSTWDRKLVSVSYTGALQSNPLEQTAKMGYRAANPTINLVTTNPGDLLITAFGHFSTTEIASSNQTSIYNDRTGTNTIGAASYQIAGDLGTYTDTYSVVGTSNTANSLVMATFIHDCPATTTSTSSSTSSSISTSSSTSVSTTTITTSTSTTTLIFDTRTQGKLKQPIFLKWHGVSK